MIQNESWDRVIQEHYLRYLGQPERRFVIDDMPAPAPNPISILEIAPSSDGDCWAYATVGAIRIPMPTPEKLFGSRKERIELLILSDRQCDELQGILTSLIAYPFCKQTWLGVGHTIPGPKGVTDDSPLTDILLTEPQWLEGLGVLHHSDDDHTRVLCVMPIYPSERDFKVERGYDAFLDLLSNNDADVAGLARPPLI
jgi:hypothetical protein